MLGLLPALGLLLGLGYLAITFWLTRRWKTLEESWCPSYYTPKTRLSVIVAAKNEAANLEHLVADMLAQKYPTELVEYIIINDHSTDATEEILASLQLPNHFHIIQAQGHGKKSALTQAIAYAKGQLIVTTDADCRFDPMWLSTIAWLYESKHPKFIASPVQFYQEKSLLERFQSLDFLGMMLVTGAGIHSNLFFMANGANMAFEKSAFLAVQGYEGNLHIPSGDDMFLIAKMAHTFPKESILFNKSLESTVRTPAAPNILSFFRQRWRWGSKNTAIDDWNLKLILGWVFLTSAWILLFIWSKTWWIVVILKLLGDYYLLREATTFFHRKKLMSSFLPAFVFHTLYIAVIGFISLLSKSKSW